MKTFNFNGKCSTFGGPNDHEMRPDEGLAFIYEEDLTHAWFRYLFLDKQPYGTTGIARRLNPDMFYIGCRWNYNDTPKEILRYSIALAKNPETGKSVFCRPADWGPSSRTGRNIDLSPGAADYIGVKTDEQVDVTLMVPMTESVIVSPNIDVVISIGHCPDAQGAVNPRTKISEWEYNNQLAYAIRKHCKHARTSIVFRSAARWTEADIDAKINALNPKWTIELHCNYFDGKSNRKGCGTEMWVKTSSTLAYGLAIDLQEAACDVLELPDRGVRTSDRFTYLNKTKAPAVIVESFFIDEDKDLAIGLERLDELARAYAGVLDEL